MTFAAVELGTRERSRTTAFMDLTDGTGSSVWPLTMMSFLLIDTQYSPTTCHVRSALVSFRLWFFSSSVATSIVESRQYAAVPLVVLGQLNVVSDLSTQVYCRGDVALPPTQTATRTIGASGVSFVSSLLANLYLDVDPNVQWIVQGNIEQVTLGQLVNAEIDVAFINPKNVDAELMQAVLTDPSFLIMPTYLLAPTLAYNPQIATGVNIAALNLTMSVGTLGLILYSCITAWNDPRVLEENSWLAAMLPPMARQPVPLTLISGCGGSARITLQLRAAVQEYLLTSADALLDTRIGNYSSAQSTAFDSCTDTPSGNLLYRQDETAIPSLILGVTGGAGVMAASGGSSYGFTTLTDHRDGLSGNTRPDILGMSACASDTFKQRF